MNNTIIVLLLFLPVILVGDQKPLLQSTTVPVAVVVEVTSAGLVMASNGGEVKVIHFNKQFAVVHAGKTQLVSAAHVNKSLSDISTEQLTKFLLEDGGRIKVQQKSDGKFVLDAVWEFEAYGCGPAGASAGLWETKFLTHTVPQALVDMLAAGDSLDLFAPESCTKK
ncbi:hypothetical protein M1466_01745 [Candidatus Dependentiae bacterium]|nr:hypothetical protein [Candidatus Dependentiae bacterium]